MSLSQTQEFDVLRRNAALRAWKRAYGVPFHLSAAGYGQWMFYPGEPPFLQLLLLCEKCGANNLSNITFPLPRRPSLTKQMLDAEARMIEGLILSEQGCTHLEKIALAPPRDFQAQVELELLGGM